VLKAILSLMFALQLTAPTEPGLIDGSFDSNGSQDYFPTETYSQQQPAPSIISPSLSETPAADFATESNSGLGVIDETPVQKFKKHALQKVSFSGGWLGAVSRNDLSSTFASAGFTLGMPLGSMDNLLAVTPSFRTDWINASNAIEVPSELFDVSLDLFHTRRLNDRWKALAMVRPSHRSDFKTTDNAVKVFGLGLFIWDYIPERLSVNFGAVYLGRSDITALPAVGLTWTPNTRNRLELQFPRTRLFHRLKKDGSNSELWSYVTLGIGGNTWAVTRTNGNSDEVALRDLRLTTGLEKTIAGGGGWFIETGLAVDRSIEYLSNSGSNISLSNGIIFSAGWNY
jgi:Domain of unknown function (DUF6268)